MNSKLLYLARKGKSGELFSFDYKKADGTTKRRTVRAGVNISKAFAKNGIEIKGVGNWLTEAKESGIRGMFKKKGNEWYLRAIDVNSPEGERFPKPFKLSGISNLK